MDITITINISIDYGEYDKLLDAHGTKQGHYDKTLARYSVKQ